MEWLKNIEKIEEKKSAGCCPYCGSPNTDYSFSIVTKDRYGFGDIWCNDCQKAFHISRTIVPDYLIKNSNVPPNLNYL